MIGCMILGGLALWGLSRAFHHWHRCGMAGGPWGGLGPFGRFARWHHRHHAWDGCGPGLFGPGEELRGDPWERPSRRGRRGSTVIQMIADRLEATPAQERALREAWQTFRDELSGLRGEGRKSHDDIAAALRKPAFDEVLFGELFARHDDALLKARKAFVGFAARVHDALDDKQRAQLADMVERGPRFFGHRFGW